MQAASKHGSGRGNEDTGGDEIREIEETLEALSGKRVKKCINCHAAIPFGDQIPNSDWPYASPRWVHAHDGAGYPECWSKVDSAENREKLLTANYERMRIEQDDYLRPTEAQLERARRVKV